MNTPDSSGRAMDGLPGKPAATATEPLAPSRNRQRQSVHAGRFERWHQDTQVAVEEEAWLITYLDIMTLLLVMLLVMLAFSGPSNKDAQKATPAPTDAASSTGANASTSPTPSPASPSASDTAPLPVAQAEPSSPALPGPPGPLPLDKLGPNVEVIKGPAGVRFRISSELLFASGDAGLSPAGMQVLDRLLPTLNIATNQRIGVEGYADNTPTQSENYASSWELTAARAGSVVRHLESRGVNPTRMRATGYGETRAIAPNSTAAGRQANRRLELLLALPGKED
jgi:chemotaxis protein MotB